MVVISSRLDAISAQRIGSLSGCVDADPERAFNIGDVDSGIPVLLNALLLEFEHLKATISRLDAECRHLRRDGEDECAEMSISRSLKLAVVSPRKPTEPPIGEMVLPPSPSKELNGFDLEVPISTTAEEKPPHLRETGTSSSDFPGRQVTDSVMSIASTVVTGRESTTDTPTDAGIPTLPRRAACRNLGGWEEHAAAAGTSKGMSIASRLFFANHRLSHVEEQDHTNWGRQLAKKILRHAVFEQCMGLVILIDGAILGLEAHLSITDTVSPSVRSTLKYTTLVLRCLFMLELLFLFYAEKLDKIIYNTWNQFDILLVVFSVFDTIIEFYASKEIAALTVIRIVRIFRLTRAVRLFAHCRTLWLLASGLKCCLSTVLWTFVFIAVASYMFAIIGIETLPLRDKHGLVLEPPILDALGDELGTLTNYQRIAVERFGSFPHSMLSLLQVLTHDSIAAFYIPMIMSVPTSRGVFNLVYFVSFILLVSIFIMNLVTAVMVESALQQAASDRATQRAREIVRKRALLPKLREMFWKLDEDGSGEVSMQEIHDAPQWLCDELKNMVHSEDLEEIFHLLDDDDSGNVQIDEFLQGIFKASQGGDVMQRLQIARLIKQCGYIKAAIKQMESAEDLENE
eukprot:TRINITY_DN7113_c0_g2_i1.p1 TRINITY_DN7113_c0_g2~~TRINITY_DN7113_c0_g2_i1.p1  ORF type:complete len:629 (-),score=98.49 TRINITY_DN7113_c0_g2_i1:6-1892(-)